MKFQKAGNGRICFCLNLSLRSCINPSHIRKINWYLANDRVQYGHANTVLSTAMELHQDIFMRF